MRYQNVPLGMDWVRGVVSVVKRSRMHRIQGGCLLLKIEGCLVMAVKMSGCYCCSKNKLGGCCVSRGGGWQ